MKMENEWQEFTSFIREKIVAVAVVFFCVLLCYAKHAFTLNVGIDTEDLILGGMSNLNGWLTIGRFGGYYSKCILGLLEYNPYFSGVLFMLFFSLSAILWMYNFYIYGGKKRNYPYWLFGILYTTAQIWCFIFYFSMLQLELAIGVCCAALAVYLVFDALCHDRSLLRKIADYIAGAVLLIWGIASYQAILVVYLVGCIATYLVYYRSRFETDQVNMKDSWYKIIVLAVHFVVSYVGYAVVSKLFFSGSAYLESQIKWGVQPVKTVIHTILHCIRKVYFGNDIAHSYLMLVVFLLFVADMGYVATRKQSLGSRITYILVIAALGISPFALYIYMGSDTQLRTQFAFALYASFAAMYLSGWFADKLVIRTKRVGVILSILLLAFGYKQMAVNLRLWYTDDVCNQQDQIVAENVCNAVSELGLGEIPEESVVIVGCKQVNLTPVSLHYDMFGTSNFVWDYSNPAGSTIRSLAYIKAVTGIDYTAGNDEQRSIAIEKGKDMPIYPNPGYVKYVKEADLIIVKLSEYYSVEE